VNHEKSINDGQNTILDKASELRQAIDSQTKEAHKRLEEHEQQVFARQERAISDLDKEVVLKIRD